MEKYEMSVADFQDMLEKKVEEANEKEHVGINEFPTTLEAFLMDNEDLKAAGLEFGIYGDEYSPCFAEIFHQEPGADWDDRMVLWRLIPDGGVETRYELKIVDLVMVLDSMMLKDAWKEGVE